LPVQAQEPFPGGLGFAIEGGEFTYPKATGRVFEFSDDEDDEDNEEDDAGRGRLLGTLQISRGSYQ